MIFEFICRNATTALRTAITPQPLKRKCTSPFFFLPRRPVSTTRPPPAKVTKPRTKKRRVRPVSILTMLKSHGFSDDHIQKLIQKRPRVLNSVAQVMEQKLVYFRKMGFSRADIGTLFSSAPRILGTNMKNRIVPNFKVLVPFMGSKDDVVKAVLKTPTLIIGKRYSQTSICSILKSHGFSDEHIKKIVLKCPMVLNVDTESRIVPNLKTLALVMESKDDIVKAVLKTPRLIIKKRGNPASTRSLFKSHGFSDEQIEKLVKKCPSVLTSNTRVLTAKLVYFSKMGFSGTDTGTLFSSEPQLLRTNINNRMKPNFGVLFPILGSKHNVVKAVLKVPRLIMSDITTTLLPNIEILKKNGVGGPDFSDFLNIKSRLLFRRPDLLEECISRLKGMGFDFSTGRCLDALVVLGSNSIHSLERKKELLKSFGFTDDDVMSAFKRNPFFFEVAYHKIRDKVSFFMDKLHFSAPVIAANPVLLMLSLDRRIIPRCAVFNLLVSRGIKKMKMREIQLFVASDKVFMNQYVTRYLDQLPELMDALEGRVEFEGLELSCYGQPNLETLREHYVPKETVKKLIKKYPNVMKVNPSHLLSVVMGLKGMGFDFSSDKFVDALGALGPLSDLTSKMKFTLYRSFGWSEEDIESAFVKQPLFVNVPDREIERKVQILRDRFDWSPLAISQTPTILLLDLENRIIPRCSVFKMLVSAQSAAGTRIKNHPPKESFFTMSDHKFSRTYISKYQNRVPELLELYQGLTKSPSPIDG